MDFLLRYEWPGNIRELMNLIETNFHRPPSEMRSASPIYQSLCGVHCRRRVRPCRQSARSCSTLFLKLTGIKVRPPSDCIGPA